MVIVAGCSVVITNRHLEQKLENTKPSQLCYRIQKHVTQLVRFCFPCTKNNEILIAK